MKRLHVNLSVEDLDASVRFYSKLFAAEPGVLKADYARWMLEDPRVNFAISTRQSGRGVNHLGIQAEDDGELEQVYARLREAGGPVLDEGETTCCYARSKKQWISDPQGVSWETFLTRGESAVYGHDGDDNAQSTTPPAQDHVRRPCC
ncbi:ArsI/CadI family heavy metal resistance metalloenzyme [Lentisalinibacter salinarum]|uniref:ArsI/CadI family heavy metal resistance metalloenzyme n=1 Tax=Lentisalinibacter salinarum TaxID=2992239 RepID=UPI003867804C